MNNSLLIGVAALLIGGAGGYIVGNGKSPGDATDPQAAASQAAGKSTGFSSGGKGGKSSSSSPAGRLALGKNFREIMNEPGQTRRLQALIDYYAGLGPDQFEAEMEKLGELPFGDQILAGTLLFSRWAEVAPEEAMAFAQSMGREGFYARPSVMRSWASSDPLAASTYFEDNADSLGGRRGPGGAAGQIAREWAKQDPQAALAWARDLEGDTGREAIGDLFSQVALDDPRAATQLAEGLTGEQKTEAYESIAREWSRNDFDAAEQWISTLPSDQRDVVMADAIRGLADTDPARAAAKVANLTDGEAIDDAIRSVTRNWADEDPAATAEWLVQQKSEELGRPMYETIRSWTDNDPAAALSFVNSQPEGQLRDTAAASYIRSNRDEGIAETLELAFTITDEDSQTSSIGVAVARWSGEDEAAAMEYLQNSPDLTDAQRVVITRQLEDGQRFRDRRGPGGFRGR